jgi:uncharacterized protein (DUF302 family)
VKTNFTNQGRRHFLKKITNACLYVSLISTKNTRIMNPRGVTIQPSQFSVKETIDRLETFLLKQGVKTYARINQQSEVISTGQNLSPIEFIMFGNPKVGGPIMAENPLAALDLPLKIIAWEDKQQKVWLAYNEESYIRERFSLPARMSSSLNLDPLVQKALKG